MTASLSAQQALALVENCPLPMLVMDQDGRVIGYNDAFARLAGPGPSSRLLGAARAELGGNPAQALLGTQARVCWTGSDGTEHHFALTDFDLRDSGQLRGRLFVDISRQVELEREQASRSEQLSRQALTDPETGLFNRRGILLALEPQVARSRRYNSHITVMALSLRRGQGSASARTRMARLLKDQLRWADLIGCDEGHDFILVLPETPADAAGHLAEKLEGHLRRTADDQAGDSPCGIYYGVSGWRRGDTAESLLNRAVAALEKARSERLACV